MVSFLGGIKDTLYGRETYYLLCAFPILPRDGNRVFLGGKLERRLKFRLEARVFFPFVCLSSALKD
ncbi:hypothetical protein COCVIDRAFT_99945 [Bipolaris victoriae FI3]|uniref:Uncharacterized protein n=1 Tax=Bipolaris victoriae (strain FI3) TaxID=930091 RepID=W7EIS4_BIPV3|nr:hypothetical protein COCVIDRAFT_99945 [Bipolaris victoriae FI3]